MSQTNRPIAPSADAIKEWLNDTHRTLINRRDELLAGYKRFSDATKNGIKDEDVQRRAGDFGGARGMMGAFLSECTTQRTSEKKPFLDGGRAVDAFFATLTDPISRCQADVRAKMTAFASELEVKRRAAAEAEAARLAAEAAAAQDRAIETMEETDLEDAAEASQAAEAAQAQAEATPAQLSRVRGDMGTLVSLRTRWVADYEASDLMALVKAVAAGKAPLAYLQFNQTRINFAVRSENLREAPGLVIKQERSVV